MLRVTAYPMIGRIQHDRLLSLSSCHLIWQRCSVQRCQPGDLNKAVTAAIKELVLVDRERALEDGSMQFVVKVEVEGGL